MFARLAMVVIDNSERVRLPDARSCSIYAADTDLLLPEDFELPLASPTLTLPGNVSYVNWGDFLCRDDTTAGIPPGRPSSIQASLPPSLALGDIFIR